MAERLCLVHGAWHGAWCWAPLLPALHSEGLEGYALDLTGLGTRAAQGDVQTGLATHAQDLAAFLAASKCRVVVAHSYGGCVLSQALADGVAIDHAIFLDALVLERGESLADFAPPAAAATFIAARDAGQPVPPRPRREWARLWGLVGADADHAAERLTPMPTRCFTDAVKGDPRAHPARRSYIRCTQNPNPMFDTHRARAARRGFDMHALDAPHSAFTTHPQALAALLALLRGRRA